MYCFNYFDIIPRFKNYIRVAFKRSECKKKALENLNVLSLLLLTKLKQPNIKKIYSHYS